MDDEFGLWLFAIITTMAGIFIAFLATTKSILFALPDRPYIQRARDSGALGRIVGYLVTSIRIWMIVIPLSMAFGIVNGHLPPLVEDIGYGLLLYLVSAALLGFYRVVSLFSMMLRHLNEH